MNRPYEKFLQSVVGVDHNGLPVSVASLFARLNRDPWEETTILIALDSAQAVERLAAFMMLLPDVLPKDADVNRDAEFLVAVLPGRAFGALRANLAPAQHPRSFRMPSLTPPALRVLLTYAIAVAMILGARYAFLSVTSQAYVHSAQTETVPTAQAAGPSPAQPADTPAGSGESKPRPGSSHAQDQRPPF